MKKFIPYILICLLLVIIGCETTYILMKNKNNDKVTESDKEQDNKNKEVLSDGVKLIDTKKNGDKIIQEYEVILNGNKNTLNVEFSYELEEDDYYSIEENNTVIKVFGKFNDKKLYYYLNLNNNVSDDFSVSVINNAFTENNFKIIKGSDNKNYLGIFTEYNNGISPTSNYVYLYNDELQLIKEDDDPLNTWYDDGYMTVRRGMYAYETTGNPWYKGSVSCDESNESCNYNLKIENNKIYYLVALSEVKGGEAKKLEEREYTINNNNLEYKVINTYEITGCAAGQCP